MAIRTLKKGLRECGDYNNEAQGLYLRCNIIFHGKDAKYLAVHLASLNKSPSFLNPSDSQALLQGQYGMYWEDGRSDNYVGEEDWGATSTGVLMWYSISKNVLGLDTTEDGKEPLDAGDSAEATLQATVPVKNF